MESGPSSLSGQAVLALVRLWLSLGAATAMELEACKDRITSWLCQVQIPHAVSKAGHKFNLVRYDLIGRKVAVYFQCLKPLTVSGARFLRERQCAICMRLRGGPNQVPG